MNKLLCAIKLRFWTFASRKSQDIWMYCRMKRSENRLHWMQIKGYFDKEGENKC